MFEIKDHTQKREEARRLITGTHPFVCVLGFPGYGIIPPEGLTATPTGTRATASPLFADFGHTAAAPSLALPATRSEPNSLPISTSPLVRDAFARSSIGGLSFSLLWTTTPGSLGSSLHCGLTVKPAGVVVAVTTELTVKKGEVTVKKRGGGGNGEEGGGVPLWRKGNGLSRTPKQTSLDLVLFII